MKHTIRVKARTLIDGAEYDITDHTQPVPVQSGDIIELLGLTGDLRKYMVIPGDVVNCMYCPIRPCVITDSEDNGCVFISDIAVGFVNLDTTLEGL